VKRNSAVAKRVVVIFLMAPDLRVKGWKNYSECGCGIIAPLASLCP